MKFLSSFFLCYLIGLSLLVLPGSLKSSDAPPGFYFQNGIPIASSDTTASSEVLFTGEQHQTTISEVGEVTLDYAGSTLWRPIYSTTARDGYLFLGFPQGVQIVDVANPSQPTLVSQVYLGENNGTSFDMALMDQYLLIANHYRGLEIIDISVPAAPVIVSLYNTPGGARSLDIVGNYAYVAVVGSGLLIFDVSNPASPVLTGSYTNSEHTPAPMDVDVEGSLAYLVDWDWMLLEIIDVSDPSAPELLGSYELDGHGSAIAVTGSTAYVGTRYTFYSLDVSDPHNPTLLSEYPISAYEFVLRGNYAYIHSGNLDILDVSNPSVPVLSGSYDLPRMQFAPLRISISGDIAYVPTWEGEFILDINNPEIPTLLGTYVTDWNYDVVSSRIYGDFCYVIANRDYLKIIDISDPTYPAEASTYNLPLASDIALKLGYSYVCEGDKLEILDVSDPSNPFAVGTWEGPAYQIDIVDNYAYVIADNQLTVLDINNPFSPSVSGSCTLQAVAYRIDVVGSLACVLGGNGLEVVDVSNPVAPQVIGSYDMAGAGLVASPDGYVFIAGGASGLKVIDITVPSNPTLISTYPGNFSKVTLDGDNLFVGDIIQVLDISDPSTPTLIGTLYDRYDQTRGIMASGGYLYSADGAGFLVLSVSPVPYHNDADLTINSSGISLSPEIPYENQETEISVVIRNQGFELASSFEVELATDPVFANQIDIPHIITELQGGADTTVEFTWTADAAVDTIYARVDGNNSIDEYNEDNNTAKKSIYVIPAVGLTASLSPSEIQTELGDTARFLIQLQNRTALEYHVELAISGLESHVWSLTSDTVDLLAGEPEDIWLQVAIDANCAADTSVVNFDVVCTAIEDPAVNTVTSGIIHISKLPQFSMLLPEEGQSLATNEVTFMWETNTEATSIVHYKKVSASEYSIVIGDPGLSHVAVVSGLEFDSTYVWFAESESTCGVSYSDTLSFKTGHGVVFSQNSYSYTIRRNYDQRANLQVINTDIASHEILVEVINPYDDLIVGFVGDGSVDQIVELGALETLTINMGMHAQDAESENYAIAFRLVSTAQDNSKLYDYASVNVHVIWPDTNFTLIELGRNPYTLVQSMQLQNIGDSITDFKVEMDNETGINYILNPQIDHAILAPNQSLDFELIPMFQDGGAGAAARAACAATVVATGAGKTESLELTECCDKQLFWAQESSAMICLEHGVHSWYCTNRPNVSVGFTAPYIPAGTVTSGTLSIEFTPRTSGIKPHTVRFYLNGHLIGGLINTNPIGTHEFTFDPAFLVMSESGPSRNVLQIVGRNFNGGHYAVYTNISMCLCVDNYAEFICANDEVEAREILQSRPYLFAGTPESVTILTPLPGEVSRRYGTPVEIDIQPLHTKYDIAVEVEFVGGDWQSIPVTLDQSSGTFKGFWQPNLCEDATLYASVQLCGPAVMDDIAVQVVDCLPMMHVLDGQSDPVTNRDLELIKLYPDYQDILATDPSAIGEDAITVTTDENGFFEMPATFNQGDAYMVRTQVHTESSSKHPDEMPDAYRISVDNGSFLNVDYDGDGDDDDSKLYYRTLGSAEWQFVRLEHTTIEHDLVVSVEWDADLAYLESLREGMKLASNYLYDVMDGQAYIGNILIADNKQHWSECDIRVYAQNTLHPTNSRENSYTIYGVVPHGPENYVKMPRQWYSICKEENDILNADSCFLDGPTYDLMLSSDYRTKSHELGHYLFKFLDEYLCIDCDQSWPEVTCPKPLPCHPGHNFGYMDNSYEQHCEADMGDYSSEMSSEYSYADESMRNTLQYWYNGTTWTDFEDEFEQEYEGIWASVLRPSERPGAPANTILYGPNNTASLPNVKVGKVLDAAQIDNDDNNSKTVTVAVGNNTGDLLSYVEVESGRSGRWLNQGLTGGISGSTLGRIHVLGVREGDRIKGSNFNQEISESQWQYGVMIVTEDPLSLPAAAPGEIALMLDELPEDHRAIIQVLTDETAVRALSIRSTLGESLSPTVSSTSDSLLEFLTQWDGQDHVVTLPTILATSDNLTIDAIGDSGQLFFFDCNYNTATRQDSIGLPGISGANGTVRVDISQDNAMISKLFLLTCPFPAPRSGIDSGQYRIGKVQTLGTVGSQELLGDDNFLRMRLADYTFPENLQTPGWKQGVRIYRWDETAEQWEYRGGEVDAAGNTVTVQIDRGGVYAAFTAAPYTCEDIAYMHPRGWNLVSTSVDVIDPDPDAVYGDDVPIYQLYGWNGSSYFSPTEIQSCGYGYWLMLLDSAVIDYEGLCCQPQYGPVCIDMNPVWNIVGCPFITDVDWDLTTVDSGGISLAFAEAVTRGWISSVKYGWNGTNYHFASTLEPSKAYWMASLVPDLSLCVYPSDVYQSQPAAKPGVSPTNGDFVSLSLEGSGEFVFIGLSTDATNRFDPAFDLPVPPTAPGATNPVLSLVPQYESPFTSLVQDVQYPSDTVVWLLQLSGDQSMKLVASDLSVMVSLGYQLHVSEVDGGQFRKLDANRPLEVWAGEHYVMAVRTVTTEAALPDEYYLSANYPNPFNPNTVIRFGLPRSSKITLSIYNVLGQRVTTLADTFYPAGHHELSWNGVNSHGAPVASGIYFYRLEAEDFVETKKMVLMR